MFRVSYVPYADLTAEEKEDTGADECAVLLKVTHNGKTILLESDDMEPEDCTFYRNLNWVSAALLKCYALGKADALDN